MRADDGFALDRLARFGPFFTLQTRNIDRGHGWVAVADCLDSTQTGHRILGQLVDEVGHRLARPGSLPAAKRWIAASVLHLGWAARLTSIYAGCLAMGALAPDLSAASLSLRLVGDGRIELCVEAPVAREAAAAWRGLYDGHLVALAEALRRQVRIGGRLFDGNVASALAGSLGTLAGGDGDALIDLVAQRWARPEVLAPHGAWRNTAQGLRFARTSCCGYEQLPGGSPCGDCSLRSGVVASD